MRKREWMERDVSLFELATSRAGQIFINIFVAAIWSLFLWGHVRAFQKFDAWIFLVFACSESIQIIFFLTRKRVNTVTDEPIYWLIAITGTLVPLFFTPNNLAIWQVGSFLIAIGSAIQILGLLSLNRSFGIVPAEREVKTGGMYFAVRHPIYASYIISFSGYVLTNMSLHNLLICIVAIVCMLLRLHKEEQVLAQNPSYLEYLKKTRYRLIPFVY